MNALAPALSHVEIDAGVQIGPARYTGANGTRLDFSGMGQLNFYVELVYADGGRVIIHDCRSYEHAILAAEGEARTEQVHVIDLVAL